jgi:hypothetical protein
MNPIDRNTPTSDDQRFDLLVDGELNEAARRELLSRLDEEPGGWRRCALAFLEAQSWRHVFGAIAGEPSVGLPPRRPARRFRFGGPAGTLLAMAASFMAALVLGGLVQGIRNPVIPGGVTGPEARVDRPAAGAQADKTGLAENSPPDLPGKPESALPKVRLVRLPGPDGPAGEGQIIWLPVVEGDQLSEDWLKSLPTPMSPELLEQLQQAGMRVEQRRRLLPWRMKDGRRLVVPVDEVDLHYVGSPTL